ncbi:aryl-phospho-beta-D-glucosidase BglC (GH1 family) [Paenibacillus cellulosilyticus]|uniref:Aryl-phospho-beta-D-glucosidase BglC (GH1 family) n=1 Tax=Paenibacillus cellulosilyticus TaxID=375489 RepID=A0A2V2YTS2_9BACL|nr:cellulase family glycosylhydrolase [Paenibacillus cellulosilyticus]PWV98673.1 aryl-phospho-beta-D-glucosidase BglC (GH1 family) [Paenibacillus cellulosilyticus]QKS43821.1 cellulase family glycosylhydrolase [Paenibacillus cellulosilyticus]
MALTNVSRKMAAVTLVVSLLVSLCALSIPSRVEAAQNDPASRTKMQQYVASMQPGWNLANTFDAPGSETAWGNPVVTKELIEAIAAQGYHSIRIPITWEGRIGSEPDYKLDETFMKRIQEVIDWSLDAGLYVMINLHHDSNWVFNMTTDHDGVLNRFNAVWKQISAYFRDYPDKLMFESINEPRFSDDWNKDTPEYFTMLDELNQSFFNIVRHAGGKNKLRPLVIPSITANHSQARLDELYKTMTKMNDPNLIATIHYYGYYPFSVNMGGSTTFDETARADVEHSFDRAYHTFVEKGIPVVVGEFGLLGFDTSVDTIEHGEILKYFEYLTYYAKQRQLTLMLWDNGQHFDRSSFTWKNPDFYEVMHAGLQSRSSNALSDSIYLKQHDPVKDVSMPMNMNGNTLTEIRVGDRVLTAGTDYKLDGDQLTLTAGLLQSLLTDKLGDNAVLTCTFSAGAQWSFHVIQYNTPQVRSVEATRAMFIIPTTFNGDNLATMEAVYAAGGNAGPDDWTPYKQFGKSFEPDPAHNYITLNKEFFDQVKDGEVLLKLHFWSGTVVDYKLVVDGNKVSGIGGDDSEAVVSETTSEAKPAAVEKTEETTLSSPPIAQMEDTDDQETSEGEAEALWFSAGGIVLVVAALGVALVLHRRGMFR